MEQTELKDYFLMHKDICVAKIQLDVDNGNVLKIYEVYEESHMPIFAQDKQKSSLNAWLKNRSIPKSRPMLEQVLRKANLKSEGALVIECKGLSLTDQYWLRSEGETINWSDVNFFDNDFSGYMGDLLLGQSSKSKENFSSPDNTANGCLPKRWQIIDGKRYLIKGGSAPYYQEPLNEKIASLIMKRLGIPHVEYNIIWAKRNEPGTKPIPFSVCECFVTRDTELVTEDEFLKHKLQQKPKDKSEYQFYIDCCNAANIQNAQLLIDQMLIIDFLIANQDRHTNNLGLIRDANTLNFIGIAPIYDNGNSLWYDVSDNLIGCSTDYSKPFAERHCAQINFVSNLAWFDVNKLNGMDKEISEVLNSSTHISEQRRQAIVESFKKRLKLIEKFVEHRQENPKYNPVEDIEFNPTLEKFDAQTEEPELIFDSFEFITEQISESKVEKPSILEKIKQSSGSREKSVSQEGNFVKDTFDTI